MAVNNLDTLLKTLAPSLDDSSYVFCPFPDKNSLPGTDKFMPLATIQEEEGITWIITQDQADRLKLAYEQTFSRITLNVYSSLTAVGLTAAVSTTLAHRGISANVVAGYYHDHIFVASADAAKALQTLQNLSEDQEPTPITPIKVP